MDFANWNPVQQAALGSAVTWLLTALGAASVFAFIRIGRRVLDTMLGFAAGVMLAAAFWSLLDPAIEMAEQQGIPAWLPALVGFVCGSIALLVLDRLLHQLRPRAAVTASGSNLRHRSMLLTLAITFHNLPEGIAIGVAFGAAAVEGSGVTLAGAVALTIGIGVQDIPEGMAVSLPLRADGMKRGRAFMYGQLSGAIEFVGGIVGALAVVLSQSLLPYMLAFAAGAMILVTLKELIPESMGRYQGAATTGVIVGFGMMMTLDVALG